ncbi:MAG: hypothetical protein GW839_06460 [Flavobacteriales bacterium]|nr:hypothetical protein [Flavobacteriia bacterium]NCP05805.1 hypothetical protein [Flavobacteriales bacterium]PIV94492.1 MAG: hypothetical protein COW44_03990 [Flavobacteriaceae bacterium CG17_big_fil_post_rev_8_21_14_2_50_33_15]PIY11304.1 MAG: hypothetical protein COZ17_07300 [Flavobacteriaceae bacterium CG_4_10_14_3_um_filter_33_47]PJB20657.1 MAG: hypothetical protein CO117_00385 [Flavobacteriaceae bacterium CG_4_9_14_3_um_filter_33_16]
MFTTLAQQKDSVSLKNGIDKPSILALHHFGVFSSRIHQNFKLSPNLNTSVSLNYASGNTFHPFLETYIPKDPAVQKEQSQLIWYYRNFNFINQEATPADYMNIIVDAVIKEFRFNINIPINNKNEIDISIRSHLITKGKNPFSVFTGDQPIEWFHSNIAGGEDPYGRRFYGLNQVNFKYTDRNGNVLELHENDFIISGIETNYFYYPTLLNNKFKHLYLNIGSHFGINTSKFNPSLDIGISLNGIKKYIFKNHNEFHIGIGSSLLRKNIIKFDDVIDLGNNQYLASIESELEYTHYTKKKNYHSFGVNYQIQSRFNKLKESNYYRLIGNWAEINGGWQHGFSTLYKALSYWTFIYTYGRPEYKLSLYFKEDFRVNNAPDVQTGISLSFPILK